MSAFLADHPVLLLFTLTAAGALLGRLRLRGFALGPAGALFVGLGASAWDARLALPEVVGQLGLGLFAYTIGLSSGQEFLVGLRRQRTVLIASLLLLGGLTGAVAVVGAAFDVAPSVRAGLFAGTGTNTPALAAALERAPIGGIDPTVGYSIAYPLGVIAMLLAAQIAVGRRGDIALTERHAIAWTVAVERSGLSPLGELREWEGCRLAFGRTAQLTDPAGTTRIAEPSWRLVPGDLVTVIGSADDVARFCGWVGRRADLDLTEHRGQVDFRRIAVSRREHIGKTIDDLDLSPRFGANVTRVRRGDVDLVADGAFILQPGDRLRVLAPKDQLEAVADYLGDSDRELSELDAFALATGMAGGIALGYLAIPIPALGDLRLGVGGGTLVAGLLLGLVGRTGPVSWQLPPSANLTLRQIGTLIFLATVGSRAGEPFREAMSSQDGARIAGAAAVLSVLWATAAAVVMRVCIKRPGAFLGGALAGLQTQPAVLAAVWERTKGASEVGVAYAVVLPAAMIAKIILVQLLLPT